MIDMRLAVLVILLFSVVLVAACLQRLSNGSSLYKDQYAGSLNRLPINSPGDLEECRQGSCWCMACTNNTPVFPGRDNLMGGSCYVEKECNSDRLGELNNGVTTPSIFPLQFMLGSGPTFGDFGISNTYCGDRLTMAVQWLVATPEEDYPLPDSKRAMCFLSKGVMPVYVLYSNGTDIDAARAGQIGRVLGTEGKSHYEGKYSTGPVGPVVVVTEMNFDKSQVSQVAEQVIAIDDGCGNDRENNKINCFVAVAPKMNDFEALDALMDHLSGDSNRVDLVAYGVDSKYSSTCDGPRVVLEALNFSSYALYNHTKPTLITHVLFDPGTNNSANTCTWTESSVVAGYAAFFPTNIQSLQKRGVIGIAPYSFNSSGNIPMTNPLNCTSCSAASTEARLKAWYGGCSQYVNYNRLGSNDVSDTTQILFGNESGTVCNANTQYSYLAGFAFNNRDILQPNPLNNVTKANLSYACDACLMDNLSIDPNKLFPSLVPMNYKEEYCNVYPEVNQWSSARNLDPMYVRAIIVTESRFKPCEAARVCKEGYDDGNCFNAGPAQDECYGGAYDEMYIPEDTPGLGTEECPILINDHVQPGQLPNWRWCAVGMMQSLEPPVSFWPASYHPEGQNGQYYDIFQRAGISGQATLDTAKACNPNFNPFLASDSMCVGTAKMEVNMKAAKGWINSNRDKLNWNTQTAVDKTNFFAAYIAANKYSGYWDLSGSMRVATSDWPVHPRCDESLKFGDCWALGFKKSWLAKVENGANVLLDNAYCSSSEGQSDTIRCKDNKPRKEPPGYCYGYTDFLQFVKECEIPFFPYGKYDPGRLKMETYLDLLTNCKSSTCPDGKIYFQLAGKDPATIGNPYLPPEPTTPP